MQGEILGEDISGDSFQPLKCSFPTLVCQHRHDYDSPLTHRFKPEPPLPTTLCYDMIELHLPNAVHRSIISLLPSLSTPNSSPMLQSTQQNSTQVGDDSHGLYNTVKQATM